ncbi:MAG TPA: carboxylating nicotinate-nucleotide diphosphorylase [Chitinophagaceae bacterium]|nr:carboxylating nicotinate-nucleotide diphosphorylase [Chitinophagaceae bacterium]
MEFIEFIEQALQEDIQDGDHSTLACIPADARGKALLKIKEAGIIAGIDIARQIFTHMDPQAQMEVWLKDGQMVKPGEQAFEIQTSVHNILKAERLVLNIMQRMSGIASLTRKYVNQIADLPAKLLDTRKTTPNFRWFEKRAVLIGGGFNHRMGLYDMIMLKDNHIDYCGGIERAIVKTNQYLKDKNLSLQIEIEARTMEDVKTILEVGQVHRIMLDNFSVTLLKEAVEMIGGQYETEASGGITIESIRSYAETGVDFISAGAIIHHAVSMDLSLKAIKDQG